jgi:hypothetical protein
MSAVGNQPTETYADLNVRKKEKVRVIMDGENLSD